jgi:hypothetical protein
MTQLELGLRNRIFGWTLFLAGIVGGMLLGAWVFDGPLPAPERFADYSGLPRRLLRLAHIAAMALGMTNVLYGLELGRLGVHNVIARAGSTCMLVAGATMPVFLTIASFDARWKWALPIPATCAFIAVAAIAWSLRTREEAQ